MKGCESYNSYELPFICHAANMRLQALGTFGDICLICAPEHRRAGLYRVHLHYLFFQNSSLDIRT